MYNNQPTVLSIMDILNIGEIKVMKEQPWWSACSETPFLVKGAIVNDSYILMISNLRRSWVCKVKKEQIIKEKQLYNPTIETNSYSGICELLEQVISKQNKQATYTFELQNLQLVMKFHSVIKIYPLKWTFRLTQINDNETFDILCEDLVNPLLCTIKSLTNRCAYLLDQLVQTEREVLKRMNEKEKINFKSRAFDNQDEWRKALADDANLANIKLTDMDFQPFAQYCMKHFSLLKIQQKEQESKKRRPQAMQQSQPLPQTNNPNNRGDVEQKQMAIINAYQEQLEDLMNADQLGQPVDLSELLPGKSKPTQNKKKKKDFL